MAETPIEDTLIVAAHGQMRDDVSGLDTIVTSGKQEKIVGYDTSLPFLKSIFFQYKRPYRLKSGEYKFHINEKQRESLVDFASAFKKPSVYYAFPLIPDHSTLDETLERLVFIDVRVVEENTTLVYLESELCHEGDVQNRDDIATLVSESDDTIENDDSVLGWNSLLNETRECRIGNILQPLDNDRTHYEIQLPPGGATATIFGLKR